MFFVVFVIENKEFFFLLLGRFYDGFDFVFGVEWYCMDGAVFGVGDVKPFSV